MEKETTIWKKKRFSHSNNNSSENFQTMNMINKLKNLRNKRKRPQNYKNIEPLQNIHEKEDENENENDNENENKKKNPLFEGFNDDEYDGIDEGDKSAGKDDIRVRLKDFIEQFYAYIYMINYSIAYFVAQLFSTKSTDNATPLTSDDPDDKEQVKLANQFNSLMSSNTTLVPPNPKDVVLIIHFLGWFESIGLASLSIFNWYYVLFYHYDVYIKDGQETFTDVEGAIKKMVDIFDQNGNPVKDEAGNPIKEHYKKRVFMPEFFYRNNLTCAAAGKYSLFSEWIPPEFWLCFNYFFLPAFFFPENLQRFFREGWSHEMYKSFKGPNGEDGYIKNQGFFSQAFNFVLTFIMLIFILHNYSLTFKTFLIDLLNMNTQNIILNLMYLCVCYVLFTIILNGDTVCNVERLDSSYMDATSKANHMKDALDLAGGVAGKSMYFSIASTMMMFIVNLIRFLIATTISVPIGAFMCAFYILLYSFGAIFLIQPLEFFSTKYNNILSYIKKTDENNRNDLPGGPEKPWNKLLHVFYGIADFLYKFSYIIAFLMLFISMFFEFNAKISVSNLNTALTGIMGFSVLILLFACYYGVVDVALVYSKMAGLEFDLPTEPTENIQSVPINNDAKPKPMVSSTFSTIVFRILMIIALLSVYSIIFNVLVSTYGNNKASSILFWVFSSLILLFALYYFDVFDYFMEKILGPTPVENLEKNTNPTPKI